ncbi:NAD(P)-dependent oxidoreductase, partial [Vibrio parahaemolyticus]|nr:NAD(P)-dependent oxidoreductase [Vibrio parahaemolyticus]
GGKGTVNEMARILQVPHMKLLIGAVVLLLVFSRLYGMGSFWQQVMNESYIRDVKNISEEGMELLCYDPYENPLALEMGARYCSLEEIYANADIISLHCPMSEENYHLLNEKAFAQMKDGVMIINTSRGELLDSLAAIEALKQGKIGALGLDVYDNEKDLFFQDKSNDVIVDDVFRRLSACHNVLFTGHQAFLTHEALNNIA